MMKSILLINRSQFYLLTLTILFIQNVHGNGEKSSSSCHLYGHSCLGAHGKRSSEQSMNSKLVPVELDKYSYQSPSVEDQLMNRLVNYIRNGNSLSASSTSSLPGNAISSLNPLLAQLNQLTPPLDRQLLNQQIKSKRFDAIRAAYDDPQFKSYLKKSNDLVNRENNFKRTSSNDLTDYMESNY